MTTHKVGALDVGEYARYLTSSRDEERVLAARVVDQRGDYYLTPGGGTAESLGVWWGRGAEALGLAGREVERAEMIRVWEGRDPATGDLLVRRGPTGEHVAAVDCTFSAPKSVSVVWAICPDEGHRAALEAAQTRATEAALGHLERSCEVMRRRIGGNIRHEASGGLVVSRFRHHTSRVTKEQQERGYGADPQLHDHCVVANLALRQEGQEAANGRWGAIDSRELMLIQVEAGALYRAQLGAEVRKLGYDIDLVGDAWEIRGIAQELISEFSSREREVKAAIDRFTQEHGRAPREDERRSLVVLSRGGKDPNPFGDRVQWPQRAAHVEAERAVSPGGPTAWEVIGQAQGRPGATVRPELEAMAAGAVHDLTQGDRQITGPSAVVDERELRKWVARAQQAAVAWGQTSTPVADFDPVLGRVHQAPELVRLDERHWTTRDHLATERFVVDAMKARSRTGGYALAPKVIEEHIASARVPLDPEQAAAVRALCDRRGAALVVAEAGTGKGEVARVAAQAHRASGRRVVAVATAGETAQRLGKEIEADDARSLNSLIHAVRTGHLQLGASDLVVVDEASQIETRGRWDRLLIAAGDAKLVAIGDPRQFSAIEAGGLLPVLEREIGAAHLTRVYRAREEWMRDAWGAIRQGHGRQALAEFDRRGLVHIAPRRADAREAMVDAWDRDRQGRPIGEHLLVTDTTNREVDRLNALAQQRRFDAGELGAPVAEISHTDPQREGYVRTELLHVGDRVRVVDRAIPLGPGRDRLENGARATVVGATGGDVVLEVGGSLVRITAPDQEVLRLGYAQHAFGAQGVTVDRVYGLMGGWSTDRESGYVSVSRCRERAELFADADTLGVATTRPVAGEEGLRDPAREPLSEDEWHTAALEVLSARYEHSRPQVAALEVLARELETAGVAAAHAEAPAVRSNAHAMASTRQREYITALGGGLPDGASWVEASMTIDRLRGEPEGIHAARLLHGDRVPADQVVETIDLVATQRERLERAAEHQPEPADRDQSAGVVYRMPAGRELETEPPELAATSTVEQAAGALEPDAAPRAGHEAEEPGNLDRGQVEAGLLGDRDGPVSTSDEPATANRPAAELPVPAEPSLELGRDRREAAVSGGAESEDPATEAITPRADVEAAPMAEPERKQGPEEPARGTERPVDAALSALEQREAEETVRKLAAERARGLDEEPSREPRRSYRELVDDAQERALEQQQERERQMEMDREMDMGMDLGM